MAGRWMLSGGLRMWGRRLGGKERAGWCWLGGYRRVGEGGVMVKEGLSSERGFVVLYIWVGGKGMEYMFLDRFSILRSALDRFSML
jgi:hypothetical protein